MTLSLNKLDRLLSSADLIIKKYFVIDNYCVYIELLSNNNAESCLLYIPSKYEIKVSPGEHVYKLDYLDITEDGNIVDNYAGKPDNFELEKKYNDIEIDLNPDLTGKQDMEEKLEESYNHPVSLKDVSKPDKKVINEIFRQLRRLKLCVQNIKYKLCIMYKNYLCCIRRDDTFECFIIKHRFTDKERKLIITLDLETFYTKIASITVDIKTVREGIYRVLDKNQSKHVYNLQKILEYKKILTESSAKILQRKENYISYIEQLEKMLEDLTEAEKKLHTKLLEINEEYGRDTSVKGLHRDIEKSHLLTKYQHELTDLYNVKLEINNNILKIKAKYETLALKIDKICFDNIIMLDAIYKNFELLAEI